jgi:hypothetical protein
MFFTYQPLVIGPEGIWLVLRYPADPWIEKIVMVYTFSFGTVIPFAVIVVCNIIVIISIRRLCDLHLTHPGIRRNCKESPGPHVFSLQAAA